MAPRKKTDTIQLSKIRMTEDLRRKLAREAERNSTTLNGEIVDRLESSFTVENIDDLLDRKIDLTIEIAIAKTLRRVAEALQSLPAGRDTSDFYKALLAVTGEEGGK